MTRGKRRYSGDFATRARRCISPPHFPLSSSRCWRRVSAQTKESPVPEPEREKEKDTKPSSSIEILLLSLSLSCTPIRTDARALLLIISFREPAAAAKRRRARLRSRAQSDAGNVSDSTKSCLASYFLANKLSLSPKAFSLTELTAAPRKTFPHREDTRTGWELSASDTRAFFLWLARFVLIAVICTLVVDFFKSSIVFCRQ